MGLGTLDLSQPAPRTKVIPPPRNHILTKHNFKATGVSPVDAHAGEDGGATPPPLCGFTATLVQPTPTDAASVLLIGGATTNTIEDTLWKLHMPSQRWSRVPTAGGPGPIVGHTACLLASRIWVFGGVTRADTFHFTPTAAANNKNTTSPSHVAQISSPCATIDPELEDELAKRRLVASRLQAKLADLSVNKPECTTAAVIASSPVLATGSANSSPPLQDAAGSPGGGVGHEAEDADTSVECVSIEQAEARQKGSIAWRLAAGTGWGLWQVARSPWLAAKATGRGMKAVGRAMSGRSRGGSATTSDKEREYGIDPNEEEEVSVDANGLPINQPVRLASQARDAYQSPGTPLSTRSTASAPSASSSSRSSTYARGASSACDPANRRMGLLNVACDRRGETPSAALHAFDTSCDAWSHGLDVTGLPPDARYFHSACAFDELGAFYVFGGARSAGYTESCNDLWKCTVEHGAARWSRVRARGRAPSPRHGHTATNVGYGYMLVFGGVNEDGLRTVRCNDSFIFDTRTETWYPLTTYGTPPTPRAFHTATLRTGDRYLHICGGEGEGESAAQDVVLLDLETLAWSRPLSDVTIAIEMHACVALDVGQSLLLGGLSLAPSSAGDILSTACLLQTVEVLGHRDTYTQLQVKVVVVGAHSCGKTSLIRRFVEDRFLAESGVGLGSMYRTVLTLVEGKLVKVHLYDIAADATIDNLAVVMRDADAAVIVYDATDANSIENIGTMAEQVQAMSDMNDLSGMEPARIVADSPAQRYRSPSSNASREGCAQIGPAYGSDEDDDDVPIGFHTLASPACSRPRVHLVLAAHKSDALCTSDRHVPDSAGRALAQKLGAHFLPTSARDAENVDAAFLHLANRVVRDRLANTRATSECVIC